MEEWDCRESEARSPALKDQKCRMDLAIAQEREGIDKRRKEKKEKKKKNLDDSYMDC